MIRVGFFEERNEPMVWIHLESAADFQRLCMLLSNLAYGAMELLRTIDHPDVFKCMPGIIGLTFATLPVDERPDRTKFTFTAGDITWSMARQAWKSALEEHIRSLPPIVTTISSTTKLLCVSLTWSLFANGFDEGAALSQNQTQGAGQPHARVPHPIAHFAKGSDSTTLNLLGFSLTF